MKPWWMIKCKQEEDYEMIGRKENWKQIDQTPWFQIKMYICCITFALVKCNHCKKRRRKKVKEFNFFSKQYSSNIIPFPKKNLDNL